MTDLGVGVLLENGTADRPKVATKRATWDPANHSPQWCAIWKWFQRQDEVETVIQARNRDEERGWDGAGVGCDMSVRS